MTQEYIGLVLDAHPQNRPGMIQVQVKNHFEQGTPVELFGPHIAPYQAIIEKIFNEENEEITICNHPMEIVYLPWQGDVVAGSMIRKQRLES